MSRLPSSTSDSRPQTRERRRVLGSTWPGFRRNTSIRVLSRLDRVHSFAPLESRPHSGSKDTSPSFKSPRSPHLPGRRIMLRILRQQLLKGERLHHIIICTAVKPRNLVLKFSKCRQKNHRCGYIALSAPPLKPGCRP